MSIVFPAVIDGPAAIIILIAAVLIVLAFMFFIMRDGAHPTRSPYEPTTEYIKRDMSAFPGYVVATIIFFAIFLLFAKAC
jgi:hypothetical protein